MSKESRQKQRIWLMLAFLVVGYAASKFSPEQAYQQPIPTSAEQAYKQQQSDVQLTVEAQIIKLLPDDLDGNRHQKFIIETQSGQTILVAHNIDLAPKIVDLKVGDTVRIYGEYEWNNKGGILHWTHHDPAKQHPDGWVEHQNKRYQ
jgi:hypothetical protein